MMKKAMYVFLALIMFLTPLNSIYAQADNNQISPEESIDTLSLEKENYNFLEGKPGDTHLVYTYESNGSTYKVIENATENFDEVSSTIYVENNKGEFVEYATQSLTVDNSEFIHTTNANGEESTEVQDLSLEKSGTKNEEGIDPLNNVMINGSCYGQAVGGWGFVSNNNGSTRIQNYTVSAVVAAVTFVATAGAGVASGAVRTAAGVIAAKVVDERIPVLYYSRSYYELKLQNPGRGQENFIVGTNHYTNWYENSSRSLFIRATDAYSYHSCYSS